MSGQYGTTPDEKQTLVIAANGEPVMTEGASNGSFNGDVPKGLNGGLNHEQQAPKEHSIDMPDTDAPITDEGPGDTLPPPPPELLMNTPEMLKKQSHTPLSDSPPSAHTSADDYSIPEQIVVIETPPPELESPHSSSKSSLHASPQADNFVGELNVNDIYIVADAAESEPMPMEVKHIEGEETTESPNKQVCDSSNLSSI